MSVKMCSVRELINAGYTSTEIRDDSYCPPVGTFLSSFNKANYESTISGRSDNQLFPLSDISETRIVLEPSLTFEYSNLGMVDSDSSKYNAFTYTNLTGPWTVTVSNQSGRGHFSASVDSANNRVLISSNLTGTTTQFTCTVTLTGTRTDGLGTYSASFNVVQYAKTTIYYLRIYNNVSAYDGTARFQIENGNKNAIVDYNSNTEMDISLGETVTITFMYNDTAQTYDLNYKVTGSDSIDLSGGEAANTCSIGYDEIARNYPGKEGTTIDIYLVDV